MLMRVPSALRERLDESWRALASVARNPNIRRVELGWLASIAGQWSYTIALAVFAFQEGGAAAVGLVGVIRLLPAAIAAPFASGLGDRFPRERVLAIAGMLRTVTMAIAAVAVFAGIPALLIYALAGLENLVATVFRPLQGALLPMLAETPEELTAANLGFATIESVGIFAGPALGGLLLATTNTGTVFAVTAGIFLFATFLVARIRVERVPERRAAEGVLKEAFAGFVAIGHDRNLRLLVGLYGAQTLVAGALNVLIVVSALELLKIGESGVGFLTAAVGVGGLIGGFVAIVLVGRQRLASDFGWGLVLWGLPIALIALVPHTAPALVLLAAVGVGVTVVDVTAVTLLQRVVPDEVLARVFGVLQSIFVATIGLGSIVAPLLIDWIGIRGALVATGALLPTLSGLLWRRLRGLDAMAVAPAAPDLELLRRIPIFRPLQPATLEQLASNLIVVQATPAETIVRQGELGDRFYVIASGEVDVVIDDKPVGALGPGEYFGEIALLRDVPRTATVTAKTRVDLRALERDEFLSAITGHPESAEAADAVVASRLAGLRPGVASV
jgi:MFS family permease